MTDKPEKDRTQLNEWLRLVASFLFVAAGGALAFNKLSEEKANREIKRELEGDLTAKFSVKNTLVSQQNREVTGAIEFNNNSLSSVKVSKIVLHVYLVCPINELKDRLIVDANLQQLNNDYTDLSYHLDRIANNEGAESREHLEEVQKQLDQLEKRLSIPDPRQTKVLFIGRCAPDFTKYEKLQEINLGESFAIGSKSSHGYSFKLIEARPRVDGSETEWIKYDIVIDFVTEHGEKKQVGASIFSGESSEGMPEVICYPTGR